MLDKIIEAVKRQSKYTKMPVTIWTSAKKHQM